LLLDGTVSNKILSSNEHASASNRKTITPQDVFNALEDLEFPDFRPRLEAELAS
jgi:DNA polymerase epsilon subunit 3